MPSPSPVADTPQNREISIFWDFENVRLPAWADPASASKAIVNAVSKYGRIVDRRLYFDFSGAEGGLWSALDSSGFDLVNTPRRNQKETLDKKLIADVLTFAWDSAVRNDNCKPCVVLLTSDGDYAYTLSKLRDRGVMSVVMYGNDASVAEVLRASADIPMSFEHDVLKGSKGTGQDSDSATKKDTSSHGSDASSALALCKVVLQELAKEKSANDDWIFGSKIGLSFRNSIKDKKSISGDDFKECYKQARTLAVKKGWLEHGRRSLTGSSKGEIVAIPLYGSGTNPSLYSKEDFMRVTSEGKAALKASENNSDGGKASTCLFIKNVPRGAQISDLVKHLEEEHQCIVLRGNTEKGPPMTPYCFARIQVGVPRDAEKLIRLAKSSEIKLNDRILQVSYDKTARPYTGDPAFYYERIKDNQEQECEHVESPPRVIRDVSNDVCEGVLALCKTIYSCEKEGNSINDSGWLDGGGIAAKFRDTLKSSGHFNDENCDRSKDRFKEARSEGISKSLVETGRRVKLIDRSGDIEVVSKDSNTSRYTKELYIRLTSKGRQLAQGSTSDSIPRATNTADKSQGGLHVFVKMLPSNTAVTELVQFLEKIHNCSVSRASIDSVRGKMSYGNAHVEFTNRQDASKILRRASDGDGLVFKGKTLRAVPDERIPSDWGNNPMISYDKANQDCIPTTVSTVPQSFETLSVATTEALNDGQASTGEPPSISSDSGSDKSLFCAVIYKMCPSSGKPTAWQAAGLVGANFQKRLKGIAEEGKERFKKSREEVITQGLVEMGRRRLDLATRAIVVAPFFSEAAIPKNLSSETYLRLTEHGLGVARDAMGSNQSIAMGGSLSKLDATNLFISNFPRDKQINDLVEFFEQTFDISISRGCMDPLHPNAKSASAHVEFKTCQDANKVFEAAKDKDNAGLIYGGRALRIHLDRKVPIWSQCDSALFFRRNYEAGGVDYNETDKEKEDVGDENCDELESRLSKETSTCDTTADSTLFPSPSKSTTTDTGEDIRAKLEDLDTTDLLFGDNLALLYAQTVNYNIEDISTSDTLEQPPVPIPILGDGGSSMSDAVLSPIREAPDLLW